MTDLILNILAASIVLGVFVLWGLLIISIVAAIAAAILHAIQELGEGK